MRNLSALLCVLLASGASAFSNTEHTQTDLHQAYIGLPTSSQFISPPHRSTGPKNILVLTDRGVVALLESEHGQIRWRKHYQDDNVPSKVFPCSRSIVTVSNSSIQSIVHETGQARWSIASTPDAQVVCNQDDVVVLIGGKVKSYPANKMHPNNHWEYFPTEGEPIIKIGVLPSQDIQIITENTFYRLSSFGVATEPVALISSVPSDPKLIQITPNAVVFQREGEKFTSVPLIADAETVQYANVVVSYKDIGLADAGLFVGYLEKGASIIHIGETGEIGRKWDFGDADTSSLFAGYLNAERQPFIAFMGISKAISLGSMQILAAYGEGIVSGHTFPFPEHYGSFESFSFEAVTAPDTYAIGCTALIATSTGTLQAWNTETLLWLREEAIAYPDRDLFPLVIEPSAVVVKGNATPGETFLERIERHTVEMTSYVQELLYGVPEQDKFVEEGSIIFPSSRFRSLICVSSAIGKIQWRFTPEDNEDPLEWVQLGVDGDTLVALAKFASSSLNPNLVVYSIDMNSGNTLSQTRLTATSEGFNSIAYDDYDMTLFVHGSTVMETGSEDLSHLVWVERTPTEIVGKRVINSRAEVGWIFPIPAGSKIIAFAKQSLGTVASLGRVLGNRSTLRKYLNPNLFAAVLVEAERKTGTVILFDALTGVVLESIEHPDMDSKSAPSIVVRDNWVLYTYQMDEPGRASRVVTLELYDQVNMDGVKVFSKSFVSPEPLSVLGVSRTRLGISTLAPLFSTSNSQLATIPRRILDPRRPTEPPTNEDKEEMLIPYDPLVRIDDKNVLSKSKQVFGLSNVVAIPGRRESEAVILAYGLDFFVTRLAPSGTFDVLSESFNKMQLLITVSILLASLIFTSTIAKRKKIKFLWYP